RCRVRPLTAALCRPWGGPRAVLRRPPAVESEGQRAAHAPIVPGLALPIHRHELPAVPRALLHGDLRAERGHKRVAIGRAEAAELDVGTFAADGGHLRGRRGDEQRAVAVEVRLALVPVVRVLLADPVRALDVLDE